MAIPLPLGDWLEHVSYDLPFLFSPSADLSSVVMVEMDEESNKALNQTYGSWDRQVHARLLNRLTESRARLVVFDVLFGDPGSETANQALEAAIKANGKVIIGAGKTRQVRGRILIQGPTLPKEELALVANYGTAVVQLDSDSTVRQMYAGTGQMPSLAWKAAEQAGAAVAQRLSNSDPPWIRFYGPLDTLPRVSYHEALTRPLDYFTNKVVFVGGRPKFLPTGEETDVYRTPFSRWEGGLVSGLEIQATTFLNLLHGDWVERMPVPLECAVLLAVGALAAFALQLLEPAKAARAALLAALVVNVAAIILFWQVRVWFSWMIIIAVQLPFALGWSVFVNMKRLYREKEALEQSAVAAPASLPPEPTASQGTADVVSKATTLVVPADGLHSILVPDHKLLRCVGRGASGEVWLARNAVGLYHAVKLVRRSDFKDAGPYEREFKGIQKFMPVSLGHPNLVHILHVGRNDSAGIMYCIMEAAEDELRGGRVSPETYSPRNLAKEIKRRKRIPLLECLDIMLPLTDALGYLHGQQLVHRDIKPSNIIFVKGQPKFADIGLVTDVAGPGHDVSYLGTQGYIPPEGPGTPAADIYSLGKVIYEAALGRDRLQFPDLPTSLVEKADDPALFALNDIILHACEANVHNRCQSASELYQDLKSLKERLDAESKS